ncbi:MAG: 16S rRNA processing protein RimM [Christensenellaceae bacterium]|nr:16S rRNA processing protein RimM [Christensenellaceae bacterium]
MNTKPLMIGRVLKPQALKGEVKIKSEARDIEIFRELPFVFLKRGKDYIKYEVESGRTYKKFGYLKFKGIDSPEAAEKLRGEFIYAAREHASKLEEDEHYIADIEGLLVITEEGEELGEIERIMQTGAADIYCVKGKKSFMFPAIERVILGIDLEAGKMTVAKKALGEVAIYD